MRTLASLLLGFVVLAWTGCHAPPPPDSLVLTQVPLDAAPIEAATVLDLRYPPGSRVVLVTPPYRPDSVREISRGLFAAGDPVVSWDGQYVYFAGKSAETAAWQIYKAKLSGGAPEVVTRMDGGAMDPALAAHGELVFSSPVPAAGRMWTTAKPAALYGLRPKDAPRRLTFGPDSAIEPTVLRDGRILFVSANSRDDRRRPPQLALFTISNDGTEVTAYAAQGDGAAFVRRPRELDDGRIAFVAGRTADPGPADWAESVRSAAPFATRGNLFAFRTAGCRSIESASPGNVLACVDAQGLTGRAMMRHAAMFRVASTAPELGAPLFDDPRWNTVEAVGAAPRAEPAAHNSAIMAAQPHGTVLCLNVNESRDARGDTPRAAELRVTTLGADGQSRVLGKVPVAADGSVMLEVPVDVPLGFDTLDAQGRVLRHQRPSLWLRPGENRACVGCHERPNHAPRNVRALAAAADPLQLGNDDRPASSAGRTP